MFLCWRWYWNKKYIVGIQKIWLRFVVWGSEEQRLRVKSWHWAITRLKREKAAPNDKEFKPSRTPPALPETPGNEVVTLRAPALKASAVTKTSKWSFWLQRILWESRRVDLKKPSRKVPHKFSSKVNLSDFFNRATVQPHFKLFLLFLHVFRQAFSWCGFTSARKDRRAEKQDEHPFRRWSP